MPDLTFPLRNRRRLKKALDASHGADVVGDGGAPTARCVGQVGRPASASYIAGLATAAATAPRPLLIRTLGGSKIPSPRHATPGPHRPRQQAEGAARSNSSGKEGHCRARGPREKAPLAPPFLRWRNGGECASKPASSQGKGGREGGREWSERSDGGSEQK